MAAPFLNNCTLTSVALKHRVFAQRSQPVSHPTVPLLSPLVLQLKQHILQARDESLKWAYHAAHESSREKQIQMPWMALWWHFNDNIWQYTGHATLRETYCSGEKYYKENRSVFQAVRLTEATRQRSHRCQTS